MRGGIEALPLSILQEILSRQLGAEDLARLESSSSMFWAPSGIAPCESKSIAEAAAHHSCQTHPVFENLPPHARLELLAGCNGQWKQVLYFLECLLHMRGRSAHARACNNVVATAGRYHTLIVNGNGKLYITSGGDHLPSGGNRLPSLYHDIAPEPQSTLKLIFTQPTTNRILQISANFRHAAFVTETGQVFTFGYNQYCCCGVGLESDHVILKPTLVTALETTPCQQVMTGVDFIIALMRSGELYSWGRNDFGQLGHGHTRNESRPREVIMQSDNGAPDPMVQVSTSAWHVVAVTKAGQLFTWGSNFYGCLGHNNNWGVELQPKRVENGGFAELFIVCAAAGSFCSAAIDSSGLVYTWGGNNQAHSWTPLLIDSLKAYRAVQVVAYWETFVVLDNGQVHYFENGKLWSSDHCDKKRSGSFTIEGHKIQSITVGFNHGVMVTMRGAMFGFGSNDKYQLGVVDRSAQSSDIVTMPTDVFAAVTKFKGAVRLPDDK